MNTIANWEEVPIFDSEEAEALFWSENRPDLRLMESAVAGIGEAGESVTISLRIDPRMLARIKRLARARFLNYQSMIKQWLSERMEMEMANENPQPQMKTHPRNRPSGFTLIELLMVIAIIAILASLVTSLGAVAVRKSKIGRVQAELQQVKTAIETYKAKRGTYPPDNASTNNPGYDQTNALYYELVGAINVNNSGTYVTLDGRGLPITTNELLADCGVSGIANSSQTTNSSDDAAAAQNFLITLKSSQLRTNTVNGNSIVFLNVPVEINSANDFNPWHYVSSQPVHNPGSYDLWAEFLIGKKTNVICNWSDQPIVK
jgi:prepilin-type N-terminal cleavage/methylation domain-containing protein